MYAADALVLPRASHSPYLVLSCSPHRTRIEKGGSQAPYENDETQPRVSSGALFVEMFMVAMMFHEHWVEQRPCNTPILTSIP